MPNKKTKTAAKRTKPAPGNLVIAKLAVEVKNLKTIVQQNLEQQLATNEASKKRLENEIAKAEHNLKVGKIIAGVSLIAIAGILLLPSLKKWYAANNLYMGRNGIGGW